MENLDQMLDEKAKKSLSPMGGSFYCAMIYCNQELHFHFPGYALSTGGLHIFLQIFV